MIGMSRLMTIACTFLACACHESLGIVGDAHLDPPVDAPADVIVDPAGDAITDPTGESPCPPRRAEGVHVDFSLDDDRFLRGNLTLVCTGEEFVDDPSLGTLHVWLSCRSDEGTYEERHLYFQIDPYPPMDASLFFEGELLIRYAAEASSDDPIFWVNRWLTVTNRTRGLVLAAVDAETVSPEGAEDWYAPLDAWRVGGRCPPQDEYCGTLEREAVEVTGSSSFPVMVFDGTMKPLEDPGAGSYHVLVSAAHRYYFITCADMPVTQFVAVIVRLP
jgi:hypothetical protein